MSEERYIGVACPGCGRMRLLYSPDTGDLRCEKCERNREQLYDLNPVARIKELEEERDEAMNPNSTGWAAFAEKERQLNAARARIQHLEQALREIDQNTRLSVAELRAIARAAIAKHKGDLDTTTDPQAWRRAGHTCERETLDGASVCPHPSHAKAKGDA